MTRSVSAASYFDFSLFFVSAALNPPTRLASAWRLSPRLPETDILFAIGTPFWGSRLLRPKPREAVLHALVDRFHVLNARINPAPVARVVHRVVRVEDLAVGFREHRVEVLLESLVRVGRDELPEHELVVRDFVDRRR